MSKVKGLLLSELIELLSLHKERLGDLPVHIVEHGSIYPLRPDSFEGEVIKIGELKWVDWDMYILLEG